MAERALRVALDATPLIGTPTGVGAFCAGVLRGLSEREDIEVSAYAVSWRRRHAIVDRVPPGVGIAGRAMPARPLHLAWGRTNLPAIEWFVGPVDVVHGTNYVVPPTRRAARVMTIHDLTTVRFPELCDRATLAFPELVRRALARGAWVHTHSEYVASEVVELLGAKPSRVRAVASGVPPLAPPDPNAASGILPPGTDRYLLAVGTAEPRKDLPGLVRAYDAIASKRPDLALVLAGPRGWGSAELADALQRATSRDRVVLTGWLDDAALAGLMAGAQALVYPSLYEGFGYPPLQAMGLGTPVVATRAGAVEEVVGDAALLVAPRDTDALAAALCQVVDSSDTATQLATLGRERVQRYTWQRCAQGLADLYRDSADDVTR